MRKYSYKSTYCHFVQLQYHFILFDAFYRTYFCKPHRMPKNTFFNNRETIETILTMKKNLKLLVLLGLILTMPFSAIVQAMTEVKNLRTEYLRNPVGIDVETPRFSWEWNSTVRGVEQSAYEITVTSDKAGENIVWKSGKIVSDKSLNIKYAGTALLPMTRYYWHVDGWDKKDALVASTETVFFETGILNAGWGTAKWIKATTDAQGTLDEDGDFDPSTITKYTIKMDFEIKAIAAGPCFGAKDASNFFMWQINIEDGKPIFRPHSWQNGNGANHEDKDISSIIDITKDVNYHLQIDINGDKATTYINGIMIDENRVNPRGGNYGYGDLGFRQDKARTSETLEEAYFDNILVTSIVEEKETTMFQEDFSKPTNFAFTAGAVVDGRLLLGDRSLTFQKKLNILPLYYTLEMDMTLKSGNAGVIFSGSDVNNMYMWSFNTFDRTEPIIRRHFYTNNTPSTSEKLLGAFFTKADLLDHERHIKIEADSNLIKTYIDNILVDTYTDNSGKLKNGLIGFRAYTGNVDERAYYDNIVVKNIDGDTLFAENFEKETNNFDYTEIVDVAGNKKMNMFSKAGETRLLQTSANGIPMFRTDFILEKEVASAKIYSSALGVYDLFINGKRVGTPQEDGTSIYDELKPGHTDYTKRTYYMTYDVTKLLQSGANAIGAQVSSGFWNGDIVHGMYGGTLGFIAKMEIKYTDGTSKTIVTEPKTWVCSTKGPVLMGDIYNGESYDARNESNWTSVTYDDKDWYKTSLNTDFKGILTGFVGPTVQVRDSMKLTPVKITTYNGATIPVGSTDYGVISKIIETTTPGPIVLKKGETAVYDLGQNMVGWVKFTVKGLAGTKMTLRFGEMLNTTGTKSRGDDGPAGSVYTANLRGAKATLAYTLKGGNEETFNPSMSFFGFQYCTITATQDIEIKTLSGEVVGSVTEEGSTMETSNSLVNQLYKNVIWGQRGNFLSIPTDCPQRDERQGWTGDAQIFCRTAAYNADVSSFFRKWMSDMRDSQRADGAYPVIAPYSWGVGYGAGAWSEAGIIIPWTMYQMYADKGIIEENFVSMEKYMGWLAAQKGGVYLYNGAGTAYGDWLSKENTDSRYVSVCYYAYAAELMAKMSKAMSTVEGDAYAVKALKYDTLFTNIKAEFQKRYISATTGALKQNSQTSILLALKLGLYQDDTKKATAVTLLNTKIKNNGNRLTTGFVGTGTLNQTLSEVGNNDMAYNLLLQRNYPSWLYSVDQGATTIWERWDTYTVASGFNDVSMNSFNHCSYGAVAEWMYRYMAGIDVDESNPGFKHIILKPNPDMRTAFPTGQSAITNVKAKHTSYYGNIESNWVKNVDGGITYTTTVPANTTATLYLPVLSAGDEIFEGTTPAAEAEGVTLVSKGESKVVYTLKSGTYNFSIKINTGIKDNVSDKDFDIYPNPVSSVLNIAREVKDYRITDIAGNALMTGKGLSVDVSELSTGVYILFAGDQAYKFIKE